LLAVSRAGRIDAAALEPGAAVAVVVAVGPRTSVGRALARVARNVIDAFFVRRARVAIELTVTSAYAGAVRRAVGGTRTADARGTYGEAAEIGGIVIAVFVLGTGGIESAARWQPRVGDPRCAA
jgi:hypothetical protein